MTRSTSTVGAQLRVLLPVAIAVLLPCVATDAIALRLAESSELSKPSVDNPELSGPAASAGHGAGTGEAPQAGQAPTDNGIDLPENKTVRNRRIVSMRRWNGGGLGAHMQQTSDPAVDALHGVVDRRNW